MTKTTDARAHLPAADTRPQRAHNTPAGTKTWTAAEDAVLHDGYRAHGMPWCRERLPHRTPAAIQQRATKIRATSAMAPRSAQSEKVAARIAANAERARLRRLADAMWTPPAPRYPSVWAMAQGVTA